MFNFNHYKIKTIINNCIFTDEHFPHNSNFYYKKGETCNVICVSATICLLHCKERILSLKEFKEEF
jgi:hypothetical protein